jgi:hypothetical protein
MGNQGLELRNISQPGEQPKWSLRRIGDAMNLAQLFQGWDYETLTKILSRLICGWFFGRTPANLKLAQSKH